MSRKTLFLNDALYAYLLSVSFNEHPVLSELREKTALMRGAAMQIAPEQGQFMGLLVQLLGARKIMEVGVFTGYSTLSMALKLPEEGQLIACDLDANAAAIAETHWEKAGVADKITFREGAGQKTLAEYLQSEPESFDLIFIDADKKGYQGYLNQAHGLLKTGGVALIDNVLWDGKVTAEIPDAQTKAIQTFNQALFEDTRFEISLLPIGDGLTLARKC